MEQPIFGIVASDIVYAEAVAIENSNWVRANDINALLQLNQATAFFHLSSELLLGSAIETTLPLFIHSAVTPLEEILIKGPVCRINAWPGFFERKIWEISGNISSAHKNTAAKLGKELIKVADKPGLVSARIISMIINEAYFAFEQKVSTREEIDTALKLGTNYPMGPFEWSRKIGLSEIMRLLEKLSLEDARYTPAPLLKTEGIEK